MSSNFLDFSKYLFVLAHPDDEVYTCAFLHKLVEQEKNVDVIYVTSGDYAGPKFGPLREREVQCSMAILGIPEGRIHFLRIPERVLMNRVSEVRNRVLEQARISGSTCIVSHDFEGGHNGHDAVSFCASETARELDVPFYAFPAYHNWPEKRLWNQFVSPRESTDTLLLSPEEKKLKEKVIEAHATQAKFFDTVTQSSSGKLFFTREILRRVSPLMDYTQSPSVPVGYEYPGSKLRFEDFRTAIKA